VREFLGRWCDWRDCEADPVLANEQEAILYALDHQEALGLGGLLIRVEDGTGGVAAGRIGAMAIFMPGCESLLARTTRLRPLRLAWYSALSALATIVSIWRELSTKNSLFGRLRVRRMRAL
jgi:hypothetical protein